MCVWNSQELRGIAEEIKTKQHIVTICCGLFAEQPTTNNDMAQSIRQTQIPNSCSSRCVGLVFS